MPDADLIDTLAEAREFAQLSERFKEIGSALLVAAVRDDLTKLPNVASLSRRGRDFEFNRPASVIFIDLGGFKAVNDSMGHEAGNAGLIATAILLRAACDAHASLAFRAGGDEFVILTTPDRREALVATLLENGSEIPFVHDEREGRVRLCMGVTDLLADDVVFKDVLGRAELACRVAKDRSEVVVMWAVGLSADEPKSSRLRCPDPTCNATTDVSVVDTKRRPRTFLKHCGNCGGRLLDDEGTT